MIAMIHDTWYMIQHGCSVSHQLYEKMKGPTKWILCDRHVRVPPFPRARSPLFSEFAKKNFPKRHSGGHSKHVPQKYIWETNWVFNVYIVHVYTCVYMGYIYIYIHCHLCTIVDQYIHQHLIYIHKSFTEWFTRLKYLMTDWDLGYPVITPVWKMRSLSRHQKFIQIHYSSWSSLKIWCRFSAWFSMWRENLLEIISSTRSWPERIWYTIEQRHVRLLPPAEKASIATSSDPVVATVTSLGVGTTMWDVSTNVLAWQIIRQWFFGIVSKDQNHSKSINLKKLNRNATSGWWPGKIRHPWAVWRCPWWCPDL